MPIVWLLVTAAAVGVFIDIGLKWPWYIFFNKDFGPAADGSAAADAGRDGAVRRALPRHRHLSRARSTACCRSRWTTSPTPSAMSTTMLQLLMFGGLAFVIVLPLLKRKPTITLDWDWLWRRLGPRLADAVYRLARDGAAAVHRTRRARRLAACWPRSIAITARPACWRGPGRPAAWRSGRRCCSPPICSSTTSCDAAFACRPCKNHVSEVGISLATICPFS